MKRKPIVLVVKIVILVIIIKCLIESMKKNDSRSAIVPGIITPIQSANSELYTRRVSNNNDLQSILELGNYKGFVFVEKYEDKPTMFYVIDNKAYWMPAQLIQL